MSRMASKMAVDRTPVTGGINASVLLLRRVAAPVAAVPTNAMGKHIFRLLALHQSLAPMFPHVDLIAMDDTAKQMLLDDLNVELSR